MAKSEAEFVNEGMSAEELGVLGANDAPVVENGQAIEVDAGNQPQAQEPSAQPEQKMVDVRAVQEARAAARAAEQELARFRAEKAAETARLEERISLINQAMESQNKPSPPKPPSKDEDPLGFYDHQFDSVNGKFQSLEQKLEAMEKADKQRIEAEAANARRLAVVGEADAVINKAIEQNPQIQEALNFAFEGIKGDIFAEMDRRQVPAGQRQQVANQWYINMVADLAAKCPKDPAGAADFVMRNARFYGYGYQPQQPAQPEQPQAAQIPAPKTIQERAEQQERHLSLSGIQGGSAPVKLDAKALVAMTDAQFNELMKTAAGRKQAEQIMAGG